MTKIVVGSQNPVKIEAVRLAFAAVWPSEEYNVHGVEAQSGVTAQPMSDEESIRGARNRAIAALAYAGADYGVGLEGGLHQIGAYWFDCGWIVVRDQAGREGIGSTARIMTPPRIMAHIAAGMELGSANDLVFGARNSKQAEGHFGLMTRGVLTRTMSYRDGVVVALSRFLHDDLFTAV